MRSPGLADQLAFTAFTTFIYAAVILSPWATCRYTRKHAAKRRST